MERNQLIQYIRQYKRKRCPYFSSRKTGYFSTSKLKEIVEMIRKMMKQTISDSLKTKLTKIEKLLVPELHKKNKKSSMQNLKNRFEKRYGKLTTPEKKQTKTLSRRKRQKPVRFSP